MGTKGKLHAHGKTIKRLLDLLEIILGTLRVGLHGGFAWLPVGRADFAMLLPVGINTKAHSESIKSCFSLLQFSPVKILKI
jgi:hypothetical protein